MKNNHPVILAAVGGLAVLGIIVLAALGRPLPDVLGLVATTAAGALAGIILPTAAAAAGSDPRPAASAPAAKPATDGPKAPTAAPGPSGGALRSPESDETARPRTVAPGMSPVEARQAGGS